MVFLEMSRFNASILFSGTRNCRIYQLVFRLWFCNLRKGNRFDLGRFGLFFFLFANRFYVLRLLNRYNVYQKLDVILHSDF